MPHPPPLRNLAELEGANADTINRHIRWELQRMMAERKLTQMALALSIGYASSAGAFSKWATGTAAIPEAKAAQLDEVYPDFRLTLEGESFSSLHATQARRRKVQLPRPSAYDVFIASPMASATTVSGKDEAYRAERSAAVQLGEALSDYCGFSHIYYAGATIESTDAFESPTLSIEANVDALQTSRFFVLLALEPPTMPSGIYVEAGMALALAIPSVYFVPDATHLPWMLRTIGEHNSPRLPRVSIEPVGSIREAIGRVRRHRSALFSRLER